MVVTVDPVAVGGSKCRILPGTVPEPTLLRTFPTPPDIASRAPLTVPTMVRYRPN